MPEHLLQAADGLSPVTTECRVYTRLACDLSTSCQPTSAWGRKDSRWPATITDLSVAGIRLIVSRRFEPGAGLGIELPAHDGSDPSIVLARIVHVRALENGSWALGCKFISELGEDELQGLLGQQAPEPAPQELVAAPVAPSQLTEAAADDKVIPGVTLQLEVGPGKVIDCHFRRLTVPGAWPSTAGTILTIRLNTPHGARPSIRLEVVRCSQNGERWMLRGQLLSPSWDELLHSLRRPS